jgi:hypothetical protein
MASGIYVLAKGKAKITEMDTETWIKILKARAKGPFRTGRDFKRGEKLGGNGNENQRNYLRQKRSNLKSCV